MKEEPFEFGHLSGALMKAKDIPQPQLRIDARIDHYGPMDNDNKYQKEELIRIRKQIKATTDQIDNWDADEVSKQAMKSLKMDLAMKKSRLMEIEARLGLEESEGEEGAKGKGSVIGGPYEIKPVDGQFHVMNMHTGAVKGKHTTKNKALRQFRVLEAKFHSEKKTK